MTNQRACKLANQKPRLPIHTIRTRSLGLAETHWQNIALMIMMLATALFVFLAQTTQPASAGDATPAAGEENKPDVQQFNILYLKQIRDENPPLSLLDLEAEDNGVAGARLGIADNNTTGRFLNQEFTLDLKESADTGELIAEAESKVASGTMFVIADLEPTPLLELADKLSGKTAVILNAGNPDDRVREEDCRNNVLHTAPTRTMLADALSQYLSWKKWHRWFLISGPTEKDKLLTEALKRAAKRFGSKIVEERTFDYQPGSRRADGGFEQIQQQIPQFTQKAEEHDVVVVADEGRLFADYIPYRVWDPRPVAGSAGLTPRSWHPALELWGGTQFQNRFRRLAKRNMTTRDYDAWVATRAVGEAVTRKRGEGFTVINDFMHSPEFEVAAFKGVATNFRTWNGQLRQPLIVTTPKMLVSVSPQPGFLHQFTELDTLGIDKPETACKAYAK